MGPGSMVGEEDAISKDQLHSCSGLCTSMSASLYFIEYDDFMTLRSVTTAWSNIVSKSLWKENQKLLSPVHSQTNSELHY